MTRRNAPLLALLALTGALLVGGCTDDDTTPSNTATASSTPPASPTTTAPSTPTETAFGGTEIVVAVKDGKVVPPTHRVKVAEGTDVRLLVTSDEADEVHIHGFDIEQDLPAGDQATIEFTADQTGVFEIETHESGLQLVQLEVR